MTDERITDAAEEDDGPDCLECGRPNWSDHDCERESWGYCRWVFSDGGEYADCDMEAASEDGFCEDHAEAA